MVEMQDCANILNNATDRSFVIMDEVGRGTSTEDGLRLAWAIMTYLAIEIKCRTLFATHYHELATKALQSHSEQIDPWRMKIIVNGAELTLTHQIEEGINKSSYGIHIATLAGLPQRVLEIAQAFK